MKYLEVSDFHFSPKWADVSKQAGAAVLAAARSHEVDFIAVPGDLYDAPIMVTDKGGINILRAIVKSWLNYCPVVAIYGTPSHDGPGCYGPLQDLGLVVLEPGKTYWIGEEKKQGFRQRAIEITAEMSLKEQNGCILFGIPELNKQTIQAELHLSAEQANAEATNLLADYILEYVAPMRSKYPLLPAFGLLHGNVSDAHKENNPDIIMRSSDIVIHTEDLAPANLDRWSLGHIHTPWESKVINAGYPGYPGMDSNPWGKRDFVPAMNLIQFNPRDYGKPYGCKWFVTRIPYGTPERRKILTPLKSYNPAIAYWLHTSNPSDAIPAGHPWSRITFDETKIETRRVTAEQAAEVKTLADLYRLIDPTVSERVLALVDTIPQANTANQSHVDLAMTHLKVTGCTFFRGRTVEFDLSKLHDGVTSIRGGNGSGKSSLLSFCSPYPLVIGKDTSSGRPSAIKDFFSEKDSMIEKSFIVNGSKHDHLITIKGAHTQNPKTECYLYIDGASQLDCGSFDEMMETCERLYGPYQDYLLTTFYVQPLQGKTGSSLMSATMTDIRNLVQSIAGIDRESEKRHALDKLAANTKEVERLRNWITGAEQFLEDEESLNTRKKFYEQQIPAIEADKKQAEAEGAKLRTDLDLAQAVKSASDAEAARMAKDTQRIANLQSQISLKKRTIASMQDLVAALETNRAKIGANELTVQRNRAIAEAEYRNKTALREYNDKHEELTQKVQWLINEWQNDCDHVRRSNKDAMSDYVATNLRLSQSILSLETQIKDLDARVSRINIPCPSCGYIAPDVKQSIESLKNERHSLVERLKVQTSDLAVLNPPKPTNAPEMPTAITELKTQIANAQEPELEPIEKRWPELSEQELSTIKQRIADAEQASTQIATLNASIEAMQAEVANLEAETYAINENATMELLAINAAIDAKRQEWTALNAELTTAQVSIKALDEKIAKAREQRTAIDTAQADVHTANTACEDWRYISSMLQASKIPALELELLLDSIDAETTRILEAYQEARFSVATETQGAGKSGSVDRFDIIVHDSETGDSRSFMKFSPGQKAFFADAYVKALVRQRNERAHRSYKPVIMDESDGPIEPGLVADYYEMQRRYWMDCPVLAVSHSPASHEHIENSIDIEGLKA